ncbi:MAG: DNA polymerase III subunit beta [Nitrospinaceae bacterium]
MKLSIAKEQLSHGLQTILNIVSSRSTLPVLSNVLLEGLDKRLTLTATDLDVTISCSVDAEIEEPGSITLPAKKFSGIVRELASLDIDLKTDSKNFCIIQSGASFFKIHGLAAEEFPPIPTFTEQKKVALPQEKVRSMLKKTSYAVSNDESRYVLNGIYFSLKENKFLMVATDGRRLALVDEEVEIPEDSHGEFIVPTKTINELSRLLQSSGDVDIKFTESQVAISFVDEKKSDVLLISKLIDGTYPNYHQVIPNELKERVSLAREELLQALRRVEIMTSDKSSSAKLAFTENNLTITTNSPEVGEARESIAVNYKGAEVSIAFNPGFLMDPLKVLDSDEVFLELTDELSPGVIKINAPFLYVIMPMRMT